MTASGKFAAAVWAKAVNAAGSGDGYTASDLKGKTGSSRISVLFGSASLHLAGTAGLRFFLPAEPGVVLYFAQ